MFPVSWIVSIGLSFGCVCVSLFCALPTHLTPEVVSFVKKHSRTRHTPPAVLCTHFHCWKQRIKFSIYVIGLNFEKIIVFF